MTLVTLVDSEGAAKLWLSGVAGVTAAAAGVFYATPQAFQDPTKRPTAWISLSLVSEQETPDDVGLQQALIQVDCWGKTKLLAASAANAVQTAARGLRETPVTAGSTAIVTGDWQQRRWLPDPVTNTPRYQVDLLLTMRGA